MTIELDRIRNDTPGVADRIHFNNAGSSLPPRPVVAAVVNYLEQEALQGGYELREARSADIDDVYNRIASFIGASSPREIALSENATRAWDLVFYGIDFKPGDIILTCEAEYGSNAIAYLHHGTAQGAEIRVIPNDATGQIDLEILERELTDPRARLVSINHVPTQGGLVNPAEEVGKLANQAGVLYLLDACQSIGQLPIDVDTIGCDVLTATGRKFLRGPRGTGFLYVRESAIEQCNPAFLENGSAIWDSPWDYSLKPGAQRYESWEKSYGLLIGLGEAVRYASNVGIDNIWARVSLLAGDLRDSLESIPGVSISDQGQQRCGIVTFQVIGHDHQKLREALHEHSINVSVSRSTSSQWDLPTRGLKSVMRASIHYYNTETEVDTFTDVLSTLLKEA